VLDRIRQRLAVKVEYEMRHIPEAERELQIDRLMPVVEGLVASAEGRRDLAAVCASYLREHRPETTVREADTERSAPPRPAASGSAGGGGRGGGGRGRRRGRRR
jgi:hypothetical protein